MFCGCYKVNELRVIFNPNIYSRRWVHVLRWWQNVPGGQPVAEGVPGFYLHLHVLWRTTGKTREPSSCSLYIIRDHPEIRRAWLNAFFLPLLGLAMRELQKTRWWCRCRSAAANQIWRQHTAQSECNVLKIRRHDINVNFSFQIAVICCVIVCTC